MICYSQRPCLQYALIKESNKQISQFVNKSLIPNSLFLLLIFQVKIGVPRVENIFFLYLFFDINSYYSCLSYDTLTPSSSRDGQKPPTPSDVPSSCYGPCRVQYLFTTTYLPTYLLVWLFFYKGLTDEHLLVVSNFQFLLSTTSVQRLLKLRVGVFIPQSEVNHSVKNSRLR